MQPSHACCRMGMLKWGLRPYGSLDFLCNPRLQDDLIDEEGSGKIKRDLDVADNNIKLFRELLENWNPDDGPLEVRWHSFSPSLHSYLRSQSNRFKAHGPTL